MTKKRPRGPFYQKKSKFILSNYRAFLSKKIKIYSVKLPRSEIFFEKPIVTLHFLCIFAVQFQMVPIVQLVRASDCGSECRRFESDWAPWRNRLKSYFGSIFLFRLRLTRPEGSCSRGCGRPRLPVSTCARRNKSSWRLLQYPVIFQPTNISIFSKLLIIKHL